MITERISYNKLLNFTNTTAYPQISEYDRTFMFTMVAFVLLYMSLGVFISSIFHGVTLSKISIDGKKSSGNNLIKLIYSIYFWPLIFFWKIGILLYLPFVKIFGKFCKKKRYHHSISDEEFISDKNSLYNPTGNDKLIVYKVDNELKEKIKC